MSLRRSTVMWLLFAALAGGCVDTGAPDEIGSSEEPIVGGSFDSGDPAVVLLPGCTGTLIAPRVIMTAAHCVADAIGDGNTGSGTVFFGNGEDPWIDSIGIEDMAMHRLYAPPAFVQWDIAAVRLEEPAPAEISVVPFNQDPLSLDDLGLSVRIIGFGVTDGAEQTGFGTKRQVTVTLDEVTYTHIGVGTPDRNSCQGDSGGPTMAVIDGEERVIGVTSFGSDECRARSYMTRVDSMQEWLIPVVDAWDGPCAFDGECIDGGAGCRTIDPDCDPCGFEGTCAEDCEQVDLDCPLTSRIGESCEDKYDCESRVCLEARDDERLHYCSTTCDPERPLDTCPAPLSSCIDGSDGPVCAYAGPTPTAQGSPCEDGSDCRSGMCDADADICVEACGDGLPECQDPWSCENVGDIDVCTEPREGGSCAVGRSRSPATAALFLLLVVAALVRRRQSWVTGKARRDPRLHTDRKKR